MTSARVLLRQAGAGGMALSYRLPDDTSVWARPDTLDGHAARGGGGGGLPRSAASTPTGSAPSNTARWEHATMLEMRNKGRMLASPARFFGAGRRAGGGDEDLPAPTRSPAISPSNASHADAMRTDGLRQALTEGYRSAGAGSSIASKPPLA